MKIRSRYGKWQWKAAMTLQQERAGAATNFLENQRSDIKLQSII